MVGSPTPKKARLDRTRFQALIRNQTLAELTTEAHLHFVTIHPFRNGNSRVGRLLLKLMLVRTGLSCPCSPESQLAEYIAAPGANPSDDPATH